MAFRFLAPITAPSPPRPACRPSQLIVAKRTCRSPAGPMAATWVAGDRPARTAASVSAADSPAHLDASRISTRSPSTNRQASVGARPVTTRASTPRRFRASAKRPDARESAMNPVRGDLAATANFAVVVSEVPDERSGRDDERIVRRERIDAWGGAVVEQASGKARAAEILSGPGARYVAVHACSGAEVHLQHPAGRAVHAIPPSLPRAEGWRHRWRQA